MISTNINDHLIVFSPSKNVKEYVQLEKASLETMLGRFDSRHSIAHVTVGRVMIPQSKEDKFYRDLEAEMSEVEAFEFEVNGYNSFSNSGTIFLDFEKSDGFSEVIKRFEKVLKLNHLKSGSVTSKIPHMTIAKQLDKRRFIKAYFEEYFAKDYQEKFDAYELTVLRRVNNLGKFEIYRTISLFDPISSVWG